MKMKIIKFKAHIWLKMTIKQKKLFK